MLVPLKKKKNVSSPLLLQRCVFQESYANEENKTKGKTPTDCLESTDIMGLLTNKTDTNGYQRENIFGYTKILKTIADL